VELLGQGCEVVKSGKNVKVEIVVGCYTILK